MHTHTIRTKFTFGDRVRFDTKMNGSGIGTVLEIVFGSDGIMYYMIEIDRDSCDIQGGILEDEMTLIEDDAPSDTPTTLSSPRSGGSC